MKTSSLRNRIASIVSCVLVSSLLCVHAETPAAKKITALMQERVATLEQLVSLAKRQYQEGQAPVGDYLSAQNALLDAKIDLAKDRETWIALRRDKVKNLKSIEAFARERVATGTASVGEHLRARAARLEAEIELARELEKPMVPE